MKIKYLSLYLLAAGALTAGPSHAKSINMQQMLKKQTAQLKSDLTLPEECTGALCQARKKCIGYACKAGEKCEGDYCSAGTECKGRGCWGGKKCEGENCTVVY